MTRPTLATSMLVLSGVAALGGCVYREPVAPAASPPTTVVVAPGATGRVVTYPDGRYELRGDGSAVAPFYWVWIPSGATPSNPPPPPRVQTR